MTNKQQALPEQCSSCGGMGCGTPCEYGNDEMTDLIELVINSMQRYAGHKTDAKSHAEHIVNAVREHDNSRNTVLDEATNAMANAVQDMTDKEKGHVFLIDKLFEAIEKLKQPTD